MLTELDVINDMVRSTGHSGFTGAQDTHPLYRGAESKLNSVSDDVQGMALYFNTSIRRLYAQEDGTVYCPQNTLSIDPVDPCVNLVKRQSRMYNPVDLTYDIGQDYEYKIIEYLAWQDIPFNAQQYIKHRAVYEYYLERGGADPKLSHYRSNRDESYNRLHVEHIRNSKANIYRGGGNGINRLAQSTGLGSRSILRR